MRSVLGRSFCAPAQGAKTRYPKPPNGTCPWGWLLSGNFCLRVAIVLAAATVLLTVVPFADAASITSEYNTIKISGEIKQGDDVEFKKPAWLGFNPQIMSCP
jgi:hypothetical protein